MPTQAELQENLQRFTADLLSRLSDASEALVQGQPPQTRRPALRQLLRYESAALEIATGPMPEVDFCDMAVFVGLCRGVFKRHWLGIFGEGGRPMLVTWQEAEERLRGLAGSTMTEARWTQLQGLIEEWLAANPTFVAVEGIRFEAFATLTGKIAAERAGETRGIFGSVKAATTAADQALLLGERAVFLTSALPFVLRLHTRLAAYELVDDAAGQLRKATPEARGLLDGVGRRVDRFARRGGLYVIGLCAACSVLLWGGYVTAKRLT